MTCRNCKYLRVGADADGKRRPRKGNCYSCIVPDPGMPALPHSITTAYGFQWGWSLSNRRCMEPDDGEGCPMWEVRT